MVEQEPQSIPRAKMQKDHPDGVVFAFGARNGT